VAGLSRGVSITLPLDPHIKVTGVRWSTARMFKSALYPSVIEFDVDRTPSPTVGGEDACGNALDPDCGEGALGEVGQAVPNSWSPGGTPRGWSPGSPRYSRYCTHYTVRTILYSLYCHLHQVSARFRADEQPASAAAA
jgi:hypothetical protein